MVPAVIHLSVVVLHPLPVLAAESPGLGTET